MHKIMLFELSAQKALKYLFFGVISSLKRHAMIKLREILSLVLLLLVFQTSFGQRVLLLEKPGKFKNYKYFVGSEISVRTLANGSRVGGTIHEITDSSLLIDFDKEVLLQDIDMVYKSRWGYSLLSASTRIAGAGYFLLDVVNNAINNELVVEKNTVLISSGLIAFSYVLVPLKTKRMRVGDKWRIKVLDFSIDGEDVNPFLR